jgi:hypothetical protein
VDVQLVEVRERLEEVSSGVRSSRTERGRVVLGHPLGEGGRLARVQDDLVPEPERGEPAVQITGMPTDEEHSSVTDTEADEMEEHLRGLGYLE